MNKKTLSLMLSMTLALGSVTNAYTISAPISANSKVEKGDKLKYLVDNNYVKGYENGNFGYQNDIKRSEMTKLLVYANGQEELAKKLEKIKGTYKDVSITYWANGVINAATQAPSDKNGQKIVRGYPDGNFMPENNITYAELAKMLVVLVKENLTPDMINKADENWPTTWISWAQDLGVFQDITFADVNKKTTREDAFVMFYNGLSKLGKVSNYNVNNNINTNSSDILDYSIASAKVANMLNDNKNKSSKASSNSSRTKSSKDDTDKYDDRLDDLEDEIDRLGSKYNSKKIRNIEDEIDYLEDRDLSRKQEKRLNKLKDRFEDNQNKEDKSKDKEEDKSKDKEEDKSKDKEEDKSKGKEEDKSKDKEEDKSKDIEEIKKELDKEDLTVEEIREVQKKLEELKMRIIKKN